MSSHFLVWIDLEMTGLHPEQHAIIEIATIITDTNLTIIEEGPCLVIHQSPGVVQSMEEWSRNCHTRSGLLQQVHDSPISLQDAEQQTLTFIKQYIPEKVGLLAGNSVWQDRAFLYYHMPTLLSYLHYRIIDVSSIKELVRAWYPTNPYSLYQKPEVHRAQQDIWGSIAELAHYRTHFFI